jgi:hypothetical protein
MEDAARAPPDVTNEQALEWYQNMLTGMAMNRIYSTRAQR